EILGFLRDGFSSKQISELLFISKNTVDTHRRNMLHKSGSQNTLELVNFALKNGII
ncbi:MAG: response regulator transcription factor, partial [Flavobacteriales bacterium]|nr:response regulator transcription factor [Flavobacteriales bacterium]